MMSIDDYITKHAIPKMFSELDMSFRNMIASYVHNTEYNAYSTCYQNYVNGWDSIIARMRTGTGIKIRKSITNFNQSPQP